LFSIFSPHIVYYALTLNIHFLQYFVNGVAAKPGRFKNIHVISVDIALFDISVARRKILGNTGSQIGKLFDKSEKMVLDRETTKRIGDFVRQKPRAVDEIAKLLQVSWRTADRYVEEISSQGTIAVRVFRGGTRGALKIVYWTAMEIPPFTDLQEELWKKIETGRSKDDFSPLEIYQYVDEDKRRAYLEPTSEKFVYADKTINELLEKAEKEIIFFSGNSTWINYTEKGKKVTDILEKLGKKGVPMKILSRVDVAGVSNIEKIVRINRNIGKEAIEIRHSTQPLRGYVIDGKICKLREIIRPDPERDVLKRNLIVNYEFYDAEWIDWIKKVWWKLYNRSVPLTRRMESLKSIKGITFK